MAETATTETEITATPLLTRQSTHHSYGRGARVMTTLSIFLGLLTGQRGNSMIVRETVAQQLKNLRDDWSYSLPVVVVDTMWNLAFVVVSIVMLIFTEREQPDVPIRAWICVYALQCVVHVVLVWLEYRRRNRSAATAGGGSSDSDLTVTSAAKRWGNFNRIVQCLWWLVAFCWLLPNFDMHSSPRLFWLTLTFMAIDVFFAVIACLRRPITGLAVCLCFPCILAFLNFVGGQGGASEAEISVLPKYRFVVSNREDPFDVGGRMVPFDTNGQDFSQEHVLLLDQSDCCICMCPYEDGTELHLLPCNHHFHVTCIMKWLKINRKCPLICKYTIGQGVQGGAQGGASEEEISVLSKDRVVVSSVEEPLDIGGRMVPFATNGPDFSHEHALRSEDAYNEEHASSITAASEDTDQIGKRVEVLKHIQREHDQITAMRFEELALLELKYERLYEPLYLQRYTIVNGITEANPTNPTKEESVTQQLDDNTEVSEGIPDFWLNAMKANHILAKEIWDQDEDALKYLKDIRCSQIRNPNGFMLDFIFEKNPYFKNDVLSKKYHILDDVHDDEPILESAIGTRIQWYASKSLLKKTMRKKNKGKKRKPVYKTVERDSFFKFFRTPWMPDEEDNIGEDEAEELKYTMEVDYLVGSTIKQKIIPHAIEWFTGEAIQEDD